MKIVPIDETDILEEDIAFSCRVFRWGVALWRNPATQQTILVGGRVARPPKKLPPRKEKK